MKILSMSFDGSVTTVCYEDNNDVLVNTYNRNMSIDEAKADIMGLKPAKVTEKKVIVAKKRKTKKAKKEKEISIPIDGGDELKLEL